MEENKIKLSEYLQIAITIEDGTVSPEEGQEQINKFFERLVIKNYMLHQEKMIALGKILFSIGDISDELGTTMYLEAQRVSQGLLAYCVNLENDVEPLGVIFVVYDAIHQHGLYDYILQYCKEDFQLFSRMLSDMLNISHIKSLLESSALFDNAAFNEWVKGMEDLNKQLTPELLHNLATLNVNIDGGTQRILDTLSKAAYESSSRDLHNTLVSMQETNDTEEIKEDEFESETDKQMESEPEE